MSLRQDGLAQAIRDFQRLCGDEDMAAYNLKSGVAMIREGLKSAPSAAAILAMIGGAPVPVSALEVGAAVGGATCRSNLPSQLLTLTRYGLVTRVRAWLPDGGAYWVYTLSPLGQLVMRGEGQ